MASTAVLRLTPGRSEVIVDGYDVAHGLRSLTLCAGASEPEVPQLELNLVLAEVDVGGEVTVIVPPGTHEALVALGWSPPTGEDGDGE